MGMKNNISMWIQSPTNDGNSIISNNREILTEGGKFYELIKKSILKVPKYALKYNKNNLTIYQLAPHNILVYSNFNERDSSGRRIAFAANIKYKHFNDIAFLIEEEATSHGFSYSKESIQDILKYAKRNTTFLVMLILIIICIGISLSFIINF